MPKQPPHDYSQHASPRLAQQPKRTGGTPHINRFLRKITGHAMRRRGFGDTRLVELWPNIVGAHLATFSKPLRLSRTAPTHKDKHKGEHKVEHKSMQSEGATLIVKVEGAMALELQHLSPQIIERLNSYYGHAAISSLRIIQGPVTSPAAPTPAPPLKKVDIAAKADKMRDIVSPRLRHALARLFLRLKQGR